MQHPKHFGNALVDFRSGGLCLRVIRDKSQVFVQVGSDSDPDNWFDIECVLELIRRGTGAAVADMLHYSRSTGEDTALKLLSAMLKVHFADIAVLFDEKAYNSAREALEQLRREI